MFLSQIFKLSQGEYVAPTKIEAIYNDMPEIEQIFLHGSSTESKLVAVVVPADEVFVPSAKAAGLTAEYAELLQSAEARTWLLQKMTAKGREAGLQVMLLISSGKHCSQGNKFRTVDALIQLGRAIFDAQCSGSHYKIVPGCVTFTGLRAGERHCSAGQAVQRGEQFADSDPQAQAQANPGEPFCWFQ